MKTRPVITAAALLLLGAATAAGARSPKRGVSEDSFQYKAQMEAIAPGVSWYYSWGTSVGRYLENEEQMEFVPMCWNGGYDADNIRTYVKAHPSVRYLLGFNEPNFTNQANMTPQAAAEKWPEVQALAKELGLSLVAPALNYSPNPPYQSPTQWMDEFVALVGEDAFDYLAIHSYGGDGVLRQLATTFHDRYGKDVWVTEFCFWPEEGNPNSYVSPEAQISSMINSVEWLEKTDWIFRYAWFKPIGESSASKGPNYGLLISGKAENPRELSEQGKVYLNMPTFDPDAFHPAETLVAAKDFSAQQGILLGSCEDSFTDAPIEITRFNAGATADWQFDVAEAGEYNLVLRVGGQGEPLRFDPSLAVCLVEGESETELARLDNITLPGSGAPYRDLLFPLSLEAGKQTLRLRDTAPSSPSGIRISALRLTRGTTATGLTSADATTVDVWSLQGTLLRRGVSSAQPLDGLPDGIYIVDGKKIFHKQSNH